MVFQPVSVIDIFAGPAGLSEGFARYPFESARSRDFEIKLSIEKDQHAVRTLRLRSFFRHIESRKSHRAYQ